MNLLDQYRQRRLALNLTQQALASRTGMVRQQYQRLERGGNPRLDTLELAADGLNAKLMLIPLLASLGHDLPGALRVFPVPPDEMPDWVLSHRRSISPVRRVAEVGGGFSLAGVQMKFSMRERDGRFHFGHADELGDCIVRHPRRVILRYRRTKPRRCGWLRAWVSRFPRFA